MLLRQALDKRTEAEIWFHLDSAALLARLRGNGVPVASILPGSKLTIAETSDNRLITVLGVDHLVWTQDIDRIAKQYVAFLANRPKAKEEIWLTGTASGRTKAELVALGYELHENVRIR